MKNIILLLLTFSTSVLFSQNWKFQKVGNSFDGFGKIAAVQINLENEEQAMLGVVNKSDQLNLTWGINDKNGINKLSVVFLIPDYITPQKVLMAFDDETKNYLINFSYADNKIYIRNAVSLDYKSFYTQLDIISFFKIKKNVHFRVISENSNSDYTFPLSGCAAAINKTFICSAYKRANNWTDAAFEAINFASMYSRVDNGELNADSVAPLCTKYLKEAYGPYFFTQIASIESNGDEFSTTFIFKNEQGDIIAEATEESYLKNYYHFSGNVKRDLKDKLIKDTESIRLYYEAFQNNTNVIANKKISFASFSNLNKNELLFYYQTILKNKDLLDYFRLNESIYYNYEVKEYTFKVFIEAWGE